MKNKIMTRFYLIAGAALLTVSCGKKGPAFDASGSFEAEETVISAEATGVIRAFSIEEGKTLKAGESVGYIDSTQLYLRKKQLEAQIAAVLSRRPDVNTQLAALEEQLSTLEREQKRVANLLKSEAATQKQLDDINAQLAVTKKQMEAQRSTLSITSTGIGNEARPLELQIDQVKDQLARCRIVNPVAGVVLAKYARPFEVAAPGRALYRIADLSTMNLRAYVTGEQLAKVKLGQEVKVFTDSGEGKMKESTGTVTWINDKAEFTPKTIQTKDERANLVYAMKVKVPNDGTFRIGMYGEVKFE
jgi:HlyD family secretion protein